MCVAEEEERRELCAILDNTFFIAFKKLEYNGDIHRRINHLGRNGTPDSLKRSETSKKKKTQERRKIGFL